MTKPNEPTLTCSEVVERLADCVELATEAWTDRDYAVLNRAKAEKVLHSWREQTRKPADWKEVYDDVDTAITLLWHATEKIDYDKELAESCRAHGHKLKRHLGTLREQTRKGAKHETGD